MRSSVRPSSGWTSIRRARKTCRRGGRCAWSRGSCRAIRATVAGISASAVGDREALGGQVRGGAHEVGPGLLAVLLGGVFEAADGAGHAGRRGSRSRLSSVALPSASRYMSREARRGRALAEIDEGGAAVGEADEHEAAAADVAGGGMRDGEGEARRRRPRRRRCRRLRGLRRRLGGVTFGGVAGRLRLPRRALRGPRETREGRAGARPINLDSTILRR